MGDGDEVPFDKIFKMKEEAEAASQTPDPPPPTPPPPVAPIATPFGPIPTGGQTPKADPATQYQQMQQPDEFREFAEKSGCALGTASTALLAMLAALVLLITYLLVRDDGSEKTANTATTAPTAPAADPDDRPGPPDPSTLPPGAALYRGSAGPIGCIPCDGKFRLLHPTNGGVVADVLGGPGEAGQTMVFATNGTITEFGINLTNADGGKWEFALHANGNAYVASCHIAVGSTQCKTRGLDSAPIKAGDQIAVIVGNPGDPLTQGQFNASWWIVFQPS
jgi:hypothetical protein